MPKSRMTHQPAPQREYFGRRACACGVIYNCRFGDDNICPACKAKRDAVEPRRGRVHCNGGAVYWTVVNDPDNGFRAGSKFERFEFLVSLSMLAWPVGMIFENKGKTYKVVSPGVLERTDLEESIQLVAYGQKLVRRSSIWQAEAQ